MGVVTEDFSGAAGTPINGKTTTTGGQVWTASGLYQSIRDSGKLDGSGGGMCSYGDVLLYVNSGATDHYAQIRQFGVINQGSPSHQVVCAAVACVDDKNWIALAPFYGAGQFQLVKRVAGTQTVVATFTGLTLAPGDLWRIERVGTSVKCYQNGVLLGLPAGYTVADSVFSGATNAGLWLYKTSPAGTFDDFEAGSLGGGGGGGALTLTTQPVANAVLQRAKGTISRPVQLGGAYTGTLPDEVQWRLETEAGDLVAGYDWATIAGATIAGGTWSGTVTVPQDSARTGYKIKVRSRAAGAVLDETLSVSFTVGVIIEAGGQSNMAGQFGGTTPGPGLANKCAWWDGSQWVRAATQQFTAAVAALSDTLSLPVGFACTAVSATGVRQHAPAHTSTDGAVPEGQYWASFVTLLASVGGDIEGCIWYQGESGLGGSAQQYKDALNARIAGIRAATGRSGAAEFSFGIVVIGKYIGQGDSDVEARRTTQVEIANSTPGAFLAADAIYYDMADAVHLASAEYVQIGYAEGRSMAVARGASTYDGRGPRVTGASITGSTVTVAFDLNGASALTGAGALTGWEWYDGASWAAATDAAVAGNQVTFSAAGAQQVRYLYGAAPATTNLVRGNVKAHANATSTLALQPTRSAHIITRGSMTTLNYPGTPGTMLYGGRQKELPATGRGVDTLISVKNDGTSLASAPVTMGFSFPQGALALEENDLHATVDGVEIPMQADSYASHPDGSIRFAVLSMNPGAIAAGATKSVRLQTGNKKSAFNGTLTAPSLNFVAEATLYGVKGVVVRLGAASAYELGQTLTFDIVSNGTTTTYVIPCDDSMRYGPVGERVFTQYAIGNVVAAAITAGGIYRARREWGDDRIVIEPIADDHGDFTVSVVHSGSAVITQSTENSYAPPSVWTATMQDVLTTQISESNAGTITPHLRRLHGPVVSEFRQMVKFKNDVGTAHDFLTAIFDIRLYADGKIWVDTTVENTGLNAPNPRTLHYKIRLLNGATELHSIPRFAHHSRMRWHKALWIGEAAQTSVTRDMSYLFSTLATPTYSLDPAHAPTNAEITSLANTIATRAAAQTYRGPLACTLLEQGMPNTGGRPEIGLIAGYEVDYLLNQGATAHAHIRQVAEDAGTFAVHFRDETTGWPVALDNNSNVEVGNIFPTITHATELLPTIPDTAHQGSFHYIPYIMEGSAFHLDGLMFWTSWNLTRGNRAYRSSPSVGQLVDGATTGWRKMAWSLRSAAMTAFVMPDAHPRKAYYRNQLTANLVNMDAQKGVSWFNGPFGVQTIGDGRSDSWQCDFFTAVLGWMKLNGEDVASLLAHIAEFQFGRVLHAEDGLCPQWGVDYFMRVAATEAEVANITSWSQIAVAAGGARYGQACAFASGDDVDYAAVFRGAAAICADAGVPFAAQAYDVWVPLTPSLNTPTGQDRRKWAFQRRV